MHANMCAVPIAVVWANDHFGLMFQQDSANDLNASGPMRGLLLPGLGVNPFKTVRTGPNHIETKKLTCVFKLVKTGHLALLLAPQRDRHVNHAHPRLP